MAWCPVVIEPPSVLHVRADCGSRLFPAKLGIVVHYLPHQLFDHLLADEAILLTVFAIASMTSSASSAAKRDLGDPSLAPSDGCNGLRTRSLKLASNRANHTLNAAPAATPASGAKGPVQVWGQHYLGR